MDRSGADWHFLCGHLDGRVRGPSPEKNPVSQVSHLDNAVGSPACAFRLVVSNARFPLNAD
jgi:hypothetical protein